MTPSFPYSADFVHRADGPSGHVWCKGNRGAPVGVLQTVREHLPFRAATRPVMTVVSRTELSRSPGACPGVRSARLFREVIQRTVPAAKPRS